MFELCVKAEFSSAHNLRGYQGKCEELHGHNWKIEVRVKSKKIDKIGMVMDFKKIKEALKSVIEPLDHKYLNNLACFRKINPVRGRIPKVSDGCLRQPTSNGVNPTSENIAKFIYDSLKPRIPLLNSITVWENDTSSAMYKP